MSEEHAPYAVGNSPTINPATLRRCADPGYQRPTFEDVRALKEMSGKTGGDLAKRVDVDPRTWRKWTAPPEAKNSQSIPYAAWRLLLIEFGIINKPGG